LRARTARMGTGVIEIGTRGNPRFSGRWRRYKLRPSKKFRSTNQVAQEAVLMHATVPFASILVSIVLATAINSVAVAQAPKDKKGKTPAVGKAPTVQKTPAVEKAPATTPPVAAATAAPAAETNRPAAAEYQRLLEEWKTILKDMRKLKLQYQSGGIADQAEAQKGWTSLVEKGNQTAAALEAVGLKAYVEAPNEDPQLTRFLVKQADDTIQRDDYEAAKRVTDVLIAHQCPDKQILDAAAIAAYVLNDYEQAEKYFKEAKDAGVLSTYGKELEPTLREYKDLWAKEKAIREAEAKADDLP